MRFTLFGVGHRTGEKTDGEFPRATVDLAVFAVLAERWTVRPT
ncbi:hypothetical protein [Candidatus Protofrankia californiensis]|nr:hypothetical protein [Candidatus Protofrankia californiensis]